MHFGKFLLFLGVGPYPACFLLLWQDVRACIKELVYMVVKIV